MKIRTDFVTNSSSSSFAVEIRITGVNGDEYHASLHADSDFDNSVDINCSPKRIANSDSVSKLLDILDSSIRIDGGHQIFGVSEYELVDMGLIDLQTLMTELGEESGYDYSWAEGLSDDEILERARDNNEEKGNDLLLSVLDEMCDEYEGTTIPCGLTSRSNSEWTNMKEAVLENIADVSQIDKVILKGTYVAGGESASCFFANLTHNLLFEPNNIDMRQLVFLSAAVCEGDEDAIEPFSELLNHYEGGSVRHEEHCWPTGFMGGPKNSFSFDWSEAAENVREAAEQIQKWINGRRGNDDYGVETTIIDMKTGEITHKAEYGIEKYRWND